MKIPSFFSVVLIVLAALSSCKNNVEESENVSPEVPAMESNDMEKDNKAADDSAKVYSSALKWGNEDYLVRADPEGTNVKITIQPTGAIADQEGVTMTYEGRVTQAEIGDLNGDNHAEVLVYVSNPLNNISTVMAVSSNNGKSISMAYLIPTADNPKLNRGYQGGDEFAIIENVLGHRFPIYENGKPTGKIRQVSYTLVEGEAARQFQIVRIDEY